MASGVGVASLLEAPSQQHTTSLLALTAGAALATGLTVGYYLGKSEARKRSGGTRRSLGDSFESSAGAAGPSQGSAAGSARGTPEPDRNGRRVARTPDSLLDGTDPSKNTKRMVVLVRQDIDLPARQLVSHAAWVMLGAFKKVYSRRDPALKLWEAGGEPLDVLGVPSEQDMLLVQQAARAMAVPTHTFAGRDADRKQRTVMVVGPADAEVLKSFTPHLRLL